MRFYCSIAPASTAVDLPVQDDHSTLNACRARSLDLPRVTKLYGGKGAVSYADGTMPRGRAIYLSRAVLLAALSAQTGAGQILPAVKKDPSGYSRVVVLWPGGAPGALGNRDVDVPKLYCYPLRESERVRGDRFERFEPRGERAAVIVMPGGAYRTLVMEKEGAAEARWLNEHGVEAFVLEYRLGPRYHFPAPMLDGARAIRYVRSHATELGIAADKVGVWGFSAGGHLAGYLASVNDAGDPRASDLEQRVSDRPDFAILSYARLSMDGSIPRPTNLEALVGEHPTQAMINEISIDRRVTKSTAPSFIFSTGEDLQVSSLSSTAYYDALKRAGVPAELHIFERGGHGVGLGQALKTLPGLSVLETLLENWMESHGWMAIER